MPSRHLTTCALLVGLILVSSRALAKDVFVSESASGADTGADCANAHAATWFNGAGNWGAGAGQIGPGDTAHLCGTITDSLFVKAGGTSASPVTVRFESGAKISQPFCPGSGSRGCLNLSDLSYVVIDGGTDGVIENTDNGTGLGNQTGSWAVVAANCDGCEIKNLHIQNIYRRTSTTDVAIDGSTARGIVYDGNGIRVHDNVIHDLGWALCNSYTKTQSENRTYRNDVYNVDHSIAIGGGGAKKVSGIYIYDNHFHDWANWDDTTGANSYHHDGIHAFSVFDAGGFIPSYAGLYIYDNLFDGDNGGTMTGHIFMEGGFTLVDTIVANAGTATLTYKCNTRTLQAGDSVAVNGSSVAGYNGLHAVLSVSGTAACGGGTGQVTFATGATGTGTGGLADQPGYTPFAANDVDVHVFNNMSIVTHMVNQIGITCAASADIFNNTIIGATSAPGASCFGFAESSRNLHYENNITSNCNTVLSLPSTDSYASPSDVDYNGYAQCAGSYNCWWVASTDTGSFTSYRTATGLDAHSVDATATDGGVDATGHLGAASPFVGKGVDLGAAGLCTGEMTALCADRAGAPRTPAWDIGAYKYCAGGCVVPDAGPAEAGGTGGSGGAAGRAEAGPEAAVPSGADANGAGGADGAVGNVPGGGGAEESGGCGCRAARGRGTACGALWAIGLFAMGAARRRARRPGRRLAGQLEPQRRASRDLVVT